jgi:adenylosuccinate lyase
VKSGADRQAMHEKLRQSAMDAWAAVQAGQSNPLAETLATDDEIRRYLPEAEILALMDATHYVGNAPQRARSLVVKIRQTLQS